MIQKAFDRLYTLDSGKRIRVFECEVESYNEGYRIVTRTGLLNGKLIEKKEKVSEGKNKGKKNETNPLSQALLQADSLWQCKWNEGYKSYNILKEKAGSVGSITNENNPIDIKLLLVTNPTASQTNENWDYLPMLAKKFKEVKVKYPVYVQPKYNGVRCLAKIILHDTGVEAVLISRGGTYYIINHIMKQLEDLITEFTLVTGNEVPFILDGELYKHNTPLQDISGAARKGEDGLFNSNEWLEYHIYDVIDPRLLSQTQRDRITNLAALQAIANSRYKNIKFVKDKVAHDEQEVWDLHNEYVADGYEGAILRVPDALYEFNQRSKGLIKVKQFIDEEFEIKGYGINPDKGIEESFVFTLENNNGDKQRFDARPTGSAAQKKYWYDNINSLIGQMATVRFQERSKDNIPIQGHVRADLTEVLHIRIKGE